jgi:hypothetical protein
MTFKQDGNGSLCVEWEQAFGHKKRAWIQRKVDPDKDWAKTPERRYLNVVRVDKESGNPAGNATDFPVFCSLSDRQILKAFVLSVCSITGVELEQ